MNINYKVPAQIEITFSNITSIRQGRIYTSFAELNQDLQKAALMVRALRAHPLHADVIDFNVTFEDGEQYGGQFHVGHDLERDTLEEHIITFCETHPKSIHFIKRFMNPEAKSRLYYIELTAKNGKQNWFQQYTSITFAEFATYIDNTITPLGGVIDKIAVDDKTGYKFFTNEGTEWLKENQ